jgi:hypothetical protein
MLVPHEVPPGPRVFVNRVTDLARMDEFWLTRRDGWARVVVVWGLPGVGKSALVHRCVQMFQYGDGASPFPGGELYVDFGPVDGVRSSVADALASCLTALGVARTVLPASLSERSRMLRSITADRPVLIVLEDVTDAAQVEPFLPNSQASAVLVTSSGRLGELLLEGAESLLLAPLNEAQGTQMLVELVDELVDERVAAEPDAAADLVRQCGGLPLALKIAAACLIASPVMSVAALVVRIADAETGLSGFSAGGQKTVAAVFSAAYDGLGADAARLYRLLGVMPGQDIAMDTAAVLSDLPAAALQLAVESLAEMGLLQRDTPDRLSLHSMVRRHAAHLSTALDSEADREAALRRVLDHLLVKAVFADLAVLGPGRFRVTEGVTEGYTSPFTGAGPKAAALHWLNAERLNLLALQGTVATRGWHDASWQLAEALTALYVEQRYLVDWTVSSEIGANSARQAGNIRAEARLRSFVSRAWTDLGDLDRARKELLDQALPLVEVPPLVSSASRDDVRLRASVSELVARLCDATGSVEAIRAWEQTIELFTSVDDHRGVAFATFFQGCSQHLRGDLGLAEDTLRRVLPQIRAVPDARMEGRCGTELGLVLLDAGRLGEAQHEVGVAIDVLRRDGNRFYEAQAHEAAAAIAAASGDHTAERAALVRLIELHRALGSDRGAEFTDRLHRLPPA